MLILVFLGLAIWEISTLCHQARRRAVQKGAPSSMGTNPWIIPVLALALLQSTSAAIASACNPDNDIEVPIRFAPGKASWHFEGKGTDFVGQFAKGQTVTVKASGIETR